MLRFGGGGCLEAAPRPAQRVTCEEEMGWMPVKHVVHLLPGAPVRPKAMLKGR